MVKRVEEIFECDVCGRQGQRYSVSFFDGTKILDRCDKHDRKLEGLREEKGEWVTTQRATRHAFRKSSVTDLRMAQAQARRDSDSKD